MIVRGGGGTVCQYQSGIPRLTGCVFSLCVRVRLSVLSEGKTGDGTSKGVRQSYREEKTCCVFGFEEGGRQFELFYTKLLAPSISVCSDGSNYQRLLLSENKMSVKKGREPF